MPRQQEGLIEFPAQLRQRDQCEGSSMKAFREGIFIIRMHTESEKEKEGCYREREDGIIVDM